MVVWCGGCGEWYVFFFFFFFFFFFLVMGKNWVKCGVVVVVIGVCVCVCVCVCARCSKFGQNVVSVGVH